MSTTATLVTAYRSLTDEETHALQSAGCSAEVWDAIEVAETFSIQPGAFEDVTFSGQIRLGSFDATVLLTGGMQRPAGIRHAVLHNCTVGHNAYIHNIGRHIANYTIGDDVVIDNVDLLAVEGVTAFGNGTRVNVLNEAGGREVPIFDRLSAQMAHLLALHRDRPEVLKRLEAMIERHVAEVTGARGSIGAGTCIVNCGSLTNVRIGPAARLSGVTKLVDGSVHSSPDAPTKIGEGVLAEHFIVACGAILDSAAMVTNSFVGQGVKIARGFSADHSLFFANSEALHGEACSAFAGPYTVTHHRSSLLIAGHFSFYNAGSGTNQSNHRYKLGPVHQGILERGCKTGSDSYLLWPSRIGAFTTATGRHKQSLDTGDFPFSLLVEQDGQSVLIPGANLYTVGTRRDNAKWPRRDGRGDADRLDLIHFEALNPYTVGRILRGRRRLAEMQAAVEQADDSVEYVNTSGVSIPAARLHKAIGVYTMAVQWYLGGKITERLTRVAKSARPAGWVEELLQPITDSVDGTGDWLDVCGLLIPHERLDGVFGQITSGGLADLSELETTLHDLYRNYAELEWNWVISTWLSALGKSATAVTTDDVSAAITGWKQATEQWNNWVLRDAEKEFSPTARIGYGAMDGETSNADFLSVRGSLGDNAFVESVRDEMDDVAAQAESLLARIK